MKTLFLIFILSVVTLGDNYRYFLCTDCKGDRYINCFFCQGNVCTKVCSKCNGVGHYKVYSSLLQKKKFRWETCDNCQGKKCLQYCPYCKKGKKLCSSCSGRGFLKEKKPQPLVLPKFKLF